MKAFYIDNAGRSLFACLHEASGRHGVLVCPSIGYEQVHAHRALRHVAESAARAGFPTLRLDYSGTGNASGDENDPALVAAWLADIGAAIDWLQREQSCETITLIGIRLGALLAAQAATQHPVDGLILLAPVIKGRAFVREMKALSLTAGQVITGSDIEAAGFVFSAETAEDLGRLDLLQMRPKCRRVLILDRDDAPGELRLPAHFRSLGIECDQRPTPGYADLMAEPHRTEVPHETIRNIVVWMGPAPVGETSEPRSFSSHAVLPGRIRERLFPVGPAGEMFGILSEPCEVTSPARPWIVLLNAGSAYNIGPNRLHVQMARQLALAGFGCLRLDLVGLGESVSADATLENIAYSPNMFRDVAMTLAHLAPRNVVLLGLCSGAYAAFQAAARLSNPNLIEAIVINPLTFFWNAGMSLEESPAKQLETSRAVRSSLFRPSKWWKLISGQSKLGIVGAFRALFSRLRPRTKANVDPKLLTHPETEDVPGDLERITRARRHLTFLFARSEPGHALLSFAAGSQVEKRKVAGTINEYFIDDADHTFTSRKARLACLKTITQHLLTRYPAAS